MRILFTSTKGTGHARPLFPYIEEFKKRGHDVLFAAPEQLRGMASSKNVPFSPLSRVSDEAVQAHWERVKELALTDMPRFSVQDFFVKMWAADALPDLLEVAKDWAPHLIVRESAEMAGPVVADRLNTPHVRVAVHNGPGESFFLDHAPEPMEDLRKSLGLAHDKGKALMDEPSFTSFPKSFDPSEYRQTKEPIRSNTQPYASKSLPKRPEWAPDNGQPLIYLTFGTVAGNESEERDAYKTALHAVGTLPVNVLLTTGTNMDASLLTDVPDNVIVEKWVPQEDVFSYASAIVHHCGSGTLLGTLAAGLPSIAVPLFADQHSNAEQIERTGAGVVVSDLDEATLQNAITQVLANDSFRHSAARIATEMSELPDIDAAVDKMCALT